MMPGTINKIVPISTASMNRISMTNSVGRRGSDACSAAPIPRSPSVPMAPTFRYVAAVIHVEPSTPASSDSQYPQLVIMLSIAVGSAGLTLPPRAKMYMYCRQLASTRSRDSGTSLTSEALYSWNVVSSTPPID
jgi:hypothetical protein